MRRPFVSVCLGWLGAHERQLQRYADLHSNLGATRVLRRVAPAFNQFVNHRGLVLLAEDVLSTLQHDHPHIPVIIHCFSNGGAFVLWKLRAALEEAPLRFPSVHIAGVIFDSAPAFVTRTTAARAVTSGIQSPLAQAAARAVASCVMGILLAFGNPVGYL